MSESSHNPVENSDCESEPDLELAPAFDQQNQENNPDLPKIPNSDSGSEFAGSRRIQTAESN